MRRLIILAMMLPGLYLFSPPAAGASAPDEVMHHDLKVRLDPGAHSLEAVDEIRFEAGGEVFFRLGPEFTIERLVLDGREIPHALTQGQWMLPLGEEGVHIITVRYRGALAAEHESGRSVAEIRPFAGPGGSFLSSAGGWYPDFGDAPFTYSIAVDVPEDQRAITPGQLLEEETSGGRYRARFAFEQTTEGMILIAGPYRVSERVHNGIRIRTYFHPELAGLEETYLSKSAAYLDMFGRWIGPYPYSAFHVVSSTLPVGLGFPYLTLMGVKVLRLPFIPDTSLGHEVLHSWWGNGVEVDYDSGNWAEGLTTFMADYTFAENKSVKEARAMRLRWLRDFTALPPSRDQPLRAFAARIHGAAQVVGYHKAAMMFYMLRDEIGDMAFTEGIRRFWREQKFRVAGWADLVRAFEEASGRNLGPFFEQWLDRKGAPTIRLGAVEAAPKDGRFRLSTTLAQDSPAYDLSVPVVVTTATGEPRHRFRLDALAARHTVTVDTKPLGLAVDPDFEVFRRLAPAEMPPILREVMLAPEVAVIVATTDGQVREAARELAEGLLEGAVRHLDADGVGLADTPLLIIGTTAEVGAALVAAGLPPVPDELRGRGSVRVWTVRREGQERTVAVVAAEDAAALRQVIRPLPHYGSKSFLVFEGARAAVKGVWPAGKSPLRVEFR